MEDMEDILFFLSGKYRRYRKYGRYRGYFNIFSGDNPGKYLKIYGRYRRYLKIYGEYKDIEDILRSMENILFYP